MCHLAHPLICYVLFRANSEHNIAAATAALSDSQLFPTFGIVILFCIIAAILSLMPFPSLPITIIAGLCQCVL